MIILNSYSRIFEFHTSNLMRYLTILLCLFSIQVIAQQPILRPKLTIVECYQKSIHEFISDHPEMIIKSNNEQFLFVQQQPFIADYTDSILHVRIKFVDADSLQKQQTITTKKSSFFILDLQPLMLRELNAYAWIMPKKVVVKKKGKQTNYQTSYTNLLCEYLFDYTPDRVQFYLFKGKSCKENF